MIPTNVAQQFKGNFSIFHGNKCYAITSLCYVMPTVAMLLFSKNYKDKYTTPFSKANLLRMKQPGTLLSSCLRYSKQHCLLRRFPDSAGLALWYRRKWFYVLYKYPFRTLQRVESASIENTWCSVLFGEIIANCKRDTKKKIYSVDEMGNSWC